MTYFKFLKRAVSPIGMGITALLFNAISLTTYTYAQEKSAATQKTPPAKTTHSGYDGFGSDSVSKEILEKYAPPQIDPEMKSKIELLMDISSPGGGQLTSDGKTLYFNWRITGVSQVWKLDAPMGFPTQMTAGEDSTDLAGITPDNKYLILQRDSKGSEQYGLFLQSTSGGALLPIFSQPKVRAFYGFTTPDSKTIFYRANDENPGQYTVYAYDIASKKQKKVFSEEGIWAISDYWIEKDGSVDTLMMLKLKGNTSFEYHKFSLKTQKLTPVIGQDEDEYHIVNFWKSKDSYILLSNKYGNFKSIFTLEKDMRNPIPLPGMKLPMQYDVERFAIDMTRRHLAIRVNKDGYDKLFTLDAKTLTPIQLPDSVFDQSTSFDYLSDDGRYLGVTSRNSKEPSKHYIYDFDQKKLTQWHVANIPEINIENYVEPTLSTYKTKDGAEIPYFVWEPQECQKKTCPIVVNFHGGPESQSKPGFSVFANLFVEHGFIFVSPNVRGSSGYGKEWLMSDNGPKRLDVIGDIRDAATELKKKYKRNGKEPKIGVMGGSYGGYSTFVAMANFAGSYDAGAAIVGMSSLKTFLNNTAPYRRSLRVSEYGDPEKDSAALDKLSPINYVEKVQDPILIIHGASDPRVPVGEAIQFYEQSKKNAADSELVIFADEGHGVSKRANRVTYIAKILEFFEKNIGSENNKS